MKYRYGFGRILLSVGILGAFLLVTGCKQKEIMYIGSGEVEDERWGFYTNVDVSLVLDPNDNTFEETEINSTVRKGHEDEEPVITVFRYKGQYTGRPRKDGEIQIYYSEAAKNNGDFEPYVVDSYYVVEKETIKYGWDENIILYLQK